MKKAFITCHSKTGITRWYGDEISKYLKSKNIDVIKSDMEDFTNDMLNDVDYIFLGCWTHGLFIMLQHPDKVWKEFAKKLPNKMGSKLVLFTTYKILTGSMFKIMFKFLKGRFEKPSLQLKSKNGLLSDNDRLALDEIIS